MQSRLSSKTRLLLPLKKSDLYYKKGSLKGFVKSYCPVVRFMTIGSVNTCSRTLQIGCSDGYFNRLNSSDSAKVFFETLYDVFTFEDEIRWLSKG
jgi:hypothetical protein